MILLLSCSAEDPIGDDYDYWKNRIPFEPLYVVDDLNYHRSFNGVVKDNGDLSIVPEVSGLVVSNQYPGYAWAIEDSGNPPELNLIRLHDGKLIARFRDTGIQNLDWEDIAAYQDVNGNNRLIIADIGDNQQLRTGYTLYYLNEPSFTEGKDTGLLFVDFQAHRKVVHYEDGKAHDAEALFVDQERRDVFIITKREKRSMVFGLKAENMEMDWDTALYCGSFPFNSVTAADLSADRKLMVRNYLHVMVWEWEQGSNLLNVLQTTPQRLPYDQLEIQGETAAWAIGSKGYYLASEMLLNIPPQLHYWE